MVMPLRPRVNSLFSGPNLSPKLLNHEHGTQLAPSKSSDNTAAKSEAPAAASKLPDRHVKEPKAAKSLITGPLYNSKDGGPKPAPTPPASDTPVPKASTQGDQFVARVIKYVPSEVVCAYLAGKAVIDSMNQPPNQVYWLWLAVIAVISVPWTIYATSETGKKPALYQGIAAAVAFLAWSLTLGQPFQQIGGYQPGYGTLAVISVSLVVPMLDKYFN